MTNTNDLKAAMGDILAARRKAAFRHREAGDPRNPLRALPGREEEFYSAAQSLRKYDLILKLLEKEARRVTLLECKRVKVKITRVLEKVLNFWVGAGLTALGTLGFAAALQLMNAPQAATQAATILGVALALGREIARK